MQASSVVIVAHKFLTQPDDALVTFLKRNKTADVLHIRHSFSDAHDRCSTFSWYKNGSLFKEGRTRDFRGFPEFLIYVKELYFTLLWILRSGRVWDVYIGMDGLCVLFGNMLRCFGRVERTVYWAIDFVPERRFKSPWKNFVYRRVNCSGCRRADEMWDLSPRMAEARERGVGIRSSQYRAHKVVPYGVWLEEIRTYPYEMCDRNTLVFMGHLLEKQGVQLVIGAMPALLDCIPDFRFKIIGAGRFRAPLEKLARDLGVEGRCLFLGKIEDHAALQKAIALSCAAIAPYIRALDTWTKYSDPGKVKEYLACGVPVLLSDVPGNAREIEAAGCGIIIGEDRQSIVDGIVRAFDPETNAAMRHRARTYAQTFDYSHIFANIL